MHKYKIYFLSHYYSFKKKGKSFPVEEQLAVGASFIILKLIYRIKKKESMKGRKSKYISYCAIKFIKILTKFEKMILKKKNNKGARQFHNDG